jgi:glycosyltransferase involved in cell wall biosynthesis
MENDKMKILMATAFPTQGAGSGALVTTQAKSYQEAGHDVVIITGNNRTNFDKLDGVKYHLVPFTGESENPEKIEGQLPFNYLMFTTHTESTSNFWKVGLEDLKEYDAAYKKALVEEISGADVIHAQHNWLLSSTATELGKPVVTTIHGTDLMGYERSKVELETANKKLEALKEESKAGTFNMTKSDIAKVEEVYMRSSSVTDIRRATKELLERKLINASKADVMRLVEILDSKKKYEFFIKEAENSARNSDKIIVISEAQKEKFNSLFPYAKDKVELLENGYDPKTFYVDKTVKREDVIPNLTSHKTPDGKIDLDYDSLILFVGKFADFKGIDSLLIAAKLYEDKLEEEGKKALTIIVGSGALEDKLKAQEKQLGLKNTHFVGRQPHEVICKLQNLADVSLIPSRDEPFGLVVIEGTACGHPVIGSNSGGIPGILNTTKEKLEDKDIIKTDLGVLVKPLPVRPETLSAEQKDELDVISADYVIATPEERKEILKSAKEKFNLQDELEEYFSEYAKSTEALADATTQIVDKKLTFDDNYIAEYTKNNYSQDKIRDKLIGVYKEAKKLKKIKVLAD